MNKSRHFCKKEQAMNNECEILSKIGKNILELRKQRQLTQEELADYANIDRTYIGYIENGKQNVTISMLCKIANVLNVNLIDIIQ